MVAALRARAAGPGEDVFCYLLAQGGRTTITCRAALGQSARWANLYRAAGLEPGAVVIIILKHVPDLYFAFLGAMLAGCVPSFMPFPSAKQDPELYWSQHRVLFERIGAAAVATWPQNAAALAEHGAGLTLLTPEQAHVQSPDFAARPIDPDEIALLQHSSGTTGLKKGVALSYGAIAGQLDRYADELGLTPLDTVVSWLPLYHDMGLIACFLLPLAAGVPIVALDPFEWVARPGLLFDAIGSFGGTHVWLPNFAFHHLCRTASQGGVSGALPDLSGMKAFIDCSEPCRHETFELFEQTFASAGVRWEQFRVCYAMAETVFAVTQTAPGAPVTALDLDDVALAEGRAEAAEAGTGRKVVSVGRPLPDVVLRIVGEDGRDLEDGAVGEVAVQAPFLFSGYHHDPEMTRRKLRDGWYFTGDIGFRRDGELYLLGRTDDLLIVNGRNVFAHHVEFAINAETPEVKAGRCIALGVWSEAAGSQELVVVVEAEGEDAQMRRLLARNIKTVVLNGFGVMPREVKIVPPGWLAKTTSGKITRELNLRKYLAEKPL